MVPKKLRDIFRSILRKFDEVPMLTDKERRVSERRAVDHDIRFAIVGQSDDRTACIENISRGGMLLNSDTALQPNAVIHIRSAEGTPTDALLAWGKACVAKVVYCRKRGDQGKTCYGIGVRYHTPKGTHDGPHVSGADSVVVVPIGCVILDKHGKIMKTNLAFAKMLAFNRLEIVGQLLVRFVAIKDWDILHLHRMQVMEANAPHHCELQLQAHDGQIIDVEFVSNVDLVDGIKVTKCYIRDVTQHKRAYETLEKSEKKFRSLVESSFDWIWEVNEKGEFTYTSPQVESILGYTPDEMIGKRLFDFMVPEEATRISKQFYDFVKLGTPITLLKNINLHKEGHRIVLETRGAPIMDEAGNVTGYRGVDRDITQRVQAEEDLRERERDLTEQKIIGEQLREAQKMESIGRLVGGMAHHFNNRLSVILGSAELALQKTEMAQPLHADLKAIINAAERSAEIVQKLLAFAREQMAAPKVLDLNETVEGMLKMLRRLIGEDIDLAWLPGTDLWHVMMDPTQVEQILVSLCINARDAIAGVGKVTIETQNTVLDVAYCANHAGFVPGEYAMIAISDNGCGMDQEKLDKIFEPFFTTKAVGQGTGLGLSTVYGIVQQNNGFIDVYSEQGKGTTLKIYLARQAGKVVDTRKESGGAPAKPWRDSAAWRRTKPRY
jgi:PAS domain S-box-containing protein